MAGGTGVGRVSLCTHYLARSPRRSCSRRFTCWTTLFYRCGSYARCPTCRIEYLEGEPEKMTKAEVEVLQSRDLLGQVRLSCQALCDHDMSVRVLMTVSSTGLDGPGPHPESRITPEPEWVDKPA